VKQRNEEKRKKNTKEEGKESSDLTLVGNVKKLRMHILLVTQ